MSFGINLGAWNSVFAVPSQVVDSDLRIAGVYQLKVLLYILRHSGEELTYEDIGRELAIHCDDVRDSVQFWVQRGLLTQSGEELIPGKPEKAADGGENGEALSADSEDSGFDETVQQHIKPLTAQPRPNIQFVSQRLCDESSLSAMMDEAQAILQKPLSSGEICSLFMLYDSYGLPAEVILMLIQYSVSIGKANINAIEKEGIRWADDGIASVEQAEEKITQLKRRQSSWGEVASIFGIHLTGTPTKTQLNLADCWLNEWKFSKEMLREAYERCVNSKGSCDLRYINGILRKWYEGGIFTLEDIEKEDAQRKPAGRKKQKTPANSSYNIDELDDSGIFND